MRPIEVGDSAKLDFTVTAHEVELYIETSGDSNDIHRDPEAALRSPLKTGGTVPGLLSAQKFGRIFGTMLPGNGSVYRSQSLEFRRPVLIGRKYVAICTVMEVMPERHRARFDTLIVDVESGEVAVKGVAIIIHNDRL